MYDVRKDGPMVRGDGTACVGGGNVPYMCVVMVQYVCIQ